MIEEVQWVVVGAGPAGIAAIGQLIDADIPLNKIAWIDPSFTVGDFGTAWRKVQSNTPIESFIKFYNAFRAFEFASRPQSFLIERAKPEGFCPLNIAAEPLKWITQTLRNKVISICDKVLSLKHTALGWQLYLASGRQVTTQKVILALGARARTLPYSNLITIPFTTAMNPELLNQAVHTEDTIAVFGSYQSARTVEENLAKTKAVNIIHFYRSERSFEYHVASLPLSPHIECYSISPTNLITHISRCNKAIYAVGFTRRKIKIEGLPHDFLYDSQTGMIAPGIYGLGIAFPETIPYTMGRLNYNVSAIWPFVKYLKRIFPTWLHETVLLSAKESEVKQFGSKFEVYCTRESNVWQEEQLFNLEENV